MKTAAAVLAIAVQLAIPVETRAADWEQHAVIPRPEVDALVVAGRAHLWGLRISRLVEDARVRAWAQGFGRPGGPHPLPLRKIDETSDSHTYRIPGGKSWNPGGSPEIVLSISPPPGATADGLPLLGRLYFGEPRLNGEGDTVLRAHRGNFCTATLSRGDRPPPAVNCATGETFN